MKHHLEIFIRLILFVTFFQSCEVSHSVQDNLHVAEINMQNNPDSALVILEAIDAEDLNSRKLRARYALLYSMALDKNSIDLKQDSIIAPAVAFYKNHGSPDDKLKTYYYWGRIAMNAQEYEEAISRFVQAEHHADRAEDKIAVGLLYNSKMRIYRYLFDHEQMQVAAHNSASAFLAASDTLRYLDAVNGILTGYLQTRDTLKAEKCLDIYRNMWELLRIDQKSKYYSAMLFLAEDKDRSDIEEILHQYLSEINNLSAIQWIAVAKAYYNIGKYNQADDALNRYLEFKGEKNSAYYYILSLIRESLGEYNDALKSYKLYVEHSEERDLDLFESDARFIEERIAAQVRILKRNYIIVISVLTLLSLIVISIFITNKIKLRHEMELSIQMQEKARYKKMHDAACKDISRLKKTLEEVDLDYEIRKLVEERFNVLNNFITAHVSNTFTKLAASELSKLMDDHEHFLHSTHASFHIAHPKFLSFLKEHDLTIDEIQYSCLYCIGLNGSEISAYLNKPSIYNISSTLRKKLGVKNMKIDSFLRMKMKELD